MLSFLNTQYRWIEFDPCDSITFKTLINHYPTPPKHNSAARLENDDKDNAYHYALTINNQWRRMIIFKVNYAAHCFKPTFVI